MSSESPNQRFQEADALFKQQRYQDALRILEELDAAFPNTRNVMYPRAQCLYALGRTGEAMQVCDFMMALFEDASAQELKARIQAEMAASQGAAQTQRVGKARTAGAKKGVLYALIGVAAIGLVAVAGKPLLSFVKDKGGAISAMGRAVRTIDSTKPLYEAEYIFDHKVEPHGHVHASCIVECPNGDLRAVWYENAPPFPTEQRDKSDDVRIGGARRRAGEDAWDKPFVMNDSLGRSDNNPCMVIDKDNRLWLFHATLDYPPRNTWVYATVKYMVSSDYENADVPVWQKSTTLEPRFEGLEEIVTSISVEDSVKDGISAEELAIAREKIKNPETLREGWMTRVHPLIRSDGTLLLPLASEHYEIAAMALTNDGGESWTFSAPVPDTGVEQPSVVELPGGRMLAYLRTLGVEHSIEQTESLDGGMTWAPTTVTGLLHPQSGIEAIQLRSGRLALVYNDKYDDPRDSLAVSISEDEGKTWRWTRHLENTAGERFDYPSLIQAKDDSLHVTYSHNTESIKHVRFNEAWVQEGDRPAQ